MATFIADMTMSIDGFIAMKNDDPGPLFDWFRAGASGNAVRQRGMELQDGREERRDAPRGVPHQSSDPHATGREEDSPGLAEPTRRDRFGGHG
jgi:hypothetical protein